MPPRFALVGGRGILESPSPAMHNAVLGDGAYGLEVLEQAPTEASGWRSLLRSLGDRYAGVNVTTPAKRALYTETSHIADDVARAVGAVNTILFADDGAPRLATNTDVHGLLSSWRRAALFVEGRTVAIVGAGGAARAAVVAAAQAGARRLYCVARQTTAARALATVAQAQGLEADVGEWETTPAAPADLVVQACSAIDDPEVVVRIGGPTATIHDLRYGDAPLAVRRAALQRRLHFADGTAMLLAQAEAAAAHFSGQPLTPEAREAMRFALVSHLRRPQHG